MKKTAALPKQTEEKSTAIGRISALLKFYAIPLAAAGFFVSPSLVCLKTNTISLLSKAGVFLCMIMRMTFYVSLGMNNLSVRSLLFFLRISRVITGTAPSQQVDLTASIINTHANIC